jgi:hypothetical protein
LERLADWLDQRGTATIAELLDTLEGMKVVDKYYTPAQLDLLKQHREAVGEERIRQVEAEWPVLLAEVQAEMERGTDPAAPPVQALVDRWMGLLAEFTGGDQAIAKSARHMWENEASIQGMATGPMQAMMAYVDRALALRRPTS